MSHHVSNAQTQLRTAIQDEYAEVAACPTKGFHLHTCLFLADRCGAPSCPSDQQAGVEERHAGLPDPFRLRHFQ